MASKTSYHRDDLRADLLRAGHAYVAAHGHEGLSVRALAQDVGVSPGAPYHHFADRRALLLALAIDGFDRLIEPGLRIRGETGSPGEQLAAMTVAFLDFQNEHPRLLELMYESELTRPVIDPRIAEQQMRGHVLLRDAIDRAAPGLCDAESKTRTIILWSTIFGYASLVGKGLLKPFADGEDAAFSEWRAALVRQVVAVATAPAIGVQH